VISFVLLFIIYLFYGPAKDAEVEMINEILYLFIIPIMLIPGTIVICLLVGLPIRLIPKVHKWWYSNSYIAFIGLALGFLTIYVSSNFTDTIKVVENETEVIKQIPNYTILGIGWFTSAFFLLHFYPIRFIESIIEIFKVKKRDLDWTKQW
jgi:hypothetical protein